MSLAEVKGLTKSYGRLKALNNVTFRMESGIIGLIGPNGAGKSTLVKTLLGLVSADEGEASVFGMDCWKQRDRILEKVGVLHEKPRFPTWVTGREYLEHVANLKQAANIQKEIEQLSDKMGLLDFIDKKISSYSAGMVQRLGLADALVGKPHFVILDEPTANLDPIGRTEVLTMIRHLRQEEGIDFLISTHVLSELERVCDNAIILHEGTVLTHGTLPDLVAKHSSPKYVVKVNNTKSFIKNLSKQTRVKLEVKDDSIIAAVEDYDAFLTEINNLIKHDSFLLKELKPLSPSLEDVFREVMRRKANEKD
jgi:ABC-2 type transport system ATP-binding protein